VSPWDELPADPLINKWTNLSDLCLPAACYSHIYTGELNAEVDLVHTRLARAGKNAGKVWLWCLHCRRYFQAKDLKLDFLGNWQRCPFDDCRAAGLDVDIFFWDDKWCRGPGSPTSEEELHYGMQFPPDVDQESCGNAKK
jgi:hypothetical protein